MITTRKTKTANDIRKWTPLILWALLESAFSRLVKFYLGVRASIAWHITSKNKVQPLSQD